MTSEIKNEILRLKKEKNAVILVHSYQDIELDEVADYVGDSLYLSQMAAKTDADIIVFAGVYFMAETAKILSPQKKVLLPRLESGCLMADMINLEQVREFKAKHQGLPLVCYINSSAEVKSECDIICTSSNAVKIVEGVNGGIVPGIEGGRNEILFAPDTYLGTWVKSQLDGVNVITYPGYCPTHLRIKPEDIADKKAKYPEAPVLVHPECHQSIVDLADYVGSTTGIMKFAAQSDKKEFIIATELGVVERLKRDFPEKEFILATPKAICPNMKWNHIEDVLNALKYEQHEIIVDEEVAKKAYASISRMLEVSK